MVFRFTSFRDVFNFSYPTQANILKPGKTAKDFTFSFLLGSKIGTRGTAANGRKKKKKKRKIEKGLFFHKVCDMLKRKKKKPYRETFLCFNSLFITSKF